MTSSRSRGATTRTRALSAVAAGVVAGVALAFTPAAVAAPLIGWIVAAAVFMGWTWACVWPYDARETKAHASRDDPARAVTDVACLLAAVASLVAVTVVLVAAGNATGSTKVLEIALAVVSVVTSWLMIHTIFTLKYASLFYAVPAEVIDFNVSEPPEYSDFAYVAFTVGMTYQISDTDLQTKQARRLALRHMLLSYLMGAVIIAVTINLVAGLTS